MDPLEKLPQLFARFPGIGTRQSQRFVYFLLRQHPAYIRELSATIGALPNVVHTCTQCFRFFPASAREASDRCRTCRDTGRDTHTLLIVEKDADLDRIERSKIYHGQYFVLGGTIPIITERPDEIIRIRELTQAIEQGLTQGLTEVILALSVTPDGEHTADFVRTQLEPYTAKGIRFSTLGRGLSTGTELEYSDEETLRFAIKGRQEISRLST